MPTSIALRLSLACALLLGAPSTGPQAASQQGRNQLLERAYQKAHQAWEKKNYSMGIAWLKPLRSQLHKRRGATQLLASLHYSKGWKEIRAGRLQSAKRELEQSAALEPKQGNIWYSLGLISRSLKDRWGAEKNFKRTLKLIPDHFESLLELARMAYEAEELSKARRYLVRAAKLRPRDPALMLLQEQCKEDEVLDRDFKSFSSTHFHIRFSGKLPKSNEDTRQILTHLERAWRELKTILGQGPVQRIEVVLYSQKEFSALRGVQDWMGAFYDGKVRIPLKSWRTQKKKVQELMRHELAHAFVEDRLPGASSWLHEGFAQWYQGRRSRGRDFVFRKSAPRSAKELRAPFSRVKDPAIVATLYLESLVLMEDILSRGGSAKVRDLLGSAAQGGGTYAQREERALLEVQGRGLQPWIQKLAKDRSWVTPGR